MRVTPGNPDGAPLTFVFTAYPGIALHAGLLQDFWFPGCGCGACDESVDSAAEDLESTVLTVAAGGYSESVGGFGIFSLLGLNVGYNLITPYNRRSHKTRGDNYSRERLNAAREWLQRFPDGWQAWKQR